MRRWGLLLLGAVSVMPVVWAMGPISGTDNLMHVQQINGGSVVTLENGALFRPYRLDTATESWQCNAASDGAIYANTSLHTIRHCDGTSWVSLGTGAGTVTGTGTTNTLTKWTGTSSIGNATPLASSNSVAADGSTFFLSLFGTLPTTPTATTFGSLIDVTSAGAQAFAQYANATVLEAGYTGNADTAAIYAFNHATGTNADILGAQGRAGGNSGIFGGSESSTAGALIGVTGWSENTGAGPSFGVVGKASGVGVAVGVAGSPEEGTTLIGGLFTFTDNPTMTQAVVLADNGAIVSPIILARDNGTAMFTVDDGGNLRLYRTMTAAGTTGAQTIDKPAGSVNIAAGQSTLVVTNSLAIATSGILLTAMTADTVCTSFRAVRGAGSFTINANGACNAETAVYFEVRN